MDMIKIIIVLTVFSTMGVIIAFIATNDDIGTSSNFAKYYIHSDGEIYGCNGSEQHLQNCYV